MFKVETCYDWPRLVQIGSKTCPNLFFFRLMSLTDKSVLDTTSDMSIRIKCDKENHVLSITDTGVGMTKQDLITNLGKQEFYLSLFVHICIFHLPTYLILVKCKYLNGWYICLDFENDLFCIRCVHMQCFATMHSS